MADPIPVRFIAVNLGGEVGANDWLVCVRVVLDRREGNCIYGRTLRPGEIDTGEPIPLRPWLGEELHFAPGAVSVSIEDVDRMAKPGADGYAAVSGTVWTWLTFFAPSDPTLLRFLLAAARRLDTAHDLFEQVQAKLAADSATLVQTRDRVFAALGLSELLCVALGRAVHMLLKVPGRFALDITVPPSLTTRADALRDIRNAFEHIEERAMGQVRGRHTRTLCQYSTKTRSFRRASSRMRRTR